MTDFVASPRITFYTDVERFHCPRQGAQRPHYLRVVRGLCFDPSQ